MNSKIHWLTCGLAAVWGLEASEAAMVDIGPTSPEAALAQSAEEVLPEASAPATIAPAKPKLEQIKQERLSRIIIRPSTAPARTAVATAPVQESRPAHDPTLIEVPSNTLGPGEPLWVRSDRQAAQARIDAADARIAEAEAARDTYGDYDDVVVYGPHAPGWAVRGWYGNRPHVRHRGIGRTPVDDSSATDDALDRAQIQFGNNAYPKIGPIVEGQLEAQRRFGRVAAPPIIGIQNDIDRAQLRVRKGAPLPN